MTAATLVQFHSAPAALDDPRSAAPRSVGDARRPPTSVTDTLELITQLGRQTFDADGAGILIATDGTAAPTAAAGTAARQADVLQVELHQGPGLHAIARRQPVISRELRFDSRWRFWAPQAADLGFRSVLSLSLVDHEPFGAITLYSRQPSYFRTDTLAHGLGFAQEAAAAISVAVQREQLLGLAEARGIVSRAQRILMEQYQINSDQAFDLIKRSAAALNQRLRAIAERIIGDRRLPDLDLTGIGQLVGATGIGGGHHLDR